MLQQDLPFEVIDHLSFSNGKHCVTVSKISALAITTTTTIIIITIQ